MIVAVYGQVASFDFVSFDDPLYVEDNPHVQRGLTWETFAWSFSGATHTTGYWVPLTWLSILLDYQLYGMNAGGYHLTNVFFHILNTVLLFWVLDRTTGRTRRSAFVAALFALHPLHVESVAWVTERKDMLSSFFWMLTLLAYHRYVQRPGTSRYLMVFLCLLCGLMSKPMLVTLPFVLLLMDFWPLARFQANFADREQKRVFLHLIREKIPFFALVALFSVMAFLTQQAGGAVRSLSDFPLGVRFANALVAYVKYIAKMFWPVDLAFLYPHPGALPLWQVLAAGVLLALISLGAFRTIKRHPYFIFGWLWYIGTLLPVIGIVVIGPHAMADRYTYIPLIGLFVTIAWGVPDLLGQRQYKNLILAPLAAGVLLILSVLSWGQTRYWQNNITLYRHALEVTRNNLAVYLNLGFALEQKGRYDEAMGYYLKIIQIDPQYSDAYNNLGNTLASMGKENEAIASFNKALRIDPLHKKASNNLGTVFFRQGRHAEAIACFSEALKIDPDYAKAHNNLGSALAMQGRTSEAIFHFREAIRLRPNDTGAQKNLRQAISADRENSQTAGSGPAHGGSIDDRR